MGNQKVLVSYAWIVDDHNHGSANQYCRWPLKNRNIYSTENSGIDKVSLRSAGRYLLGRSLEKYGISTEMLKNVESSDTGKPRLGATNSISFNISYSEGIVVCSIGKNVEVGIDVEKYHTISASGLEPCFNEHDWNEIESSECPTRALLDRWVIKESVAKADGRGLSAPLSKIYIEYQRAFLEGKVWHLNNINLSDEYACCLATDVIVDIDLVADLVMLKRAPKLRGIYD